jgi:hypothetical protein
MTTRVEALGEAEQGWVWRCAQFTVSCVDGEWCWLNRHDWIPLTSMPSGPFFRIDNPDFSDYRDSLFGR